MPAPSSTVVRRSPADARTFISHPADPCIGYIIREIPSGSFSSQSPPPRKLVILGDTYDPSTLVPLVHDDPPFTAALPQRDPWGVGAPVRVPVSLLVHEATDAHMPPHIDPTGRTGRNRTPASVLEKTLARGHSTPGMAGAFARMVSAERLVLNHIGARYASIFTLSLSPVADRLTFLSSKVPCTRSIVYPGRAGAAAARDCTRDRAASRTVMGAREARAG